MRIIEHNGFKRVSVHEDVIHDILFLIKCRMEMHDKIYSCPESMALRYIISLISTRSKNKSSYNLITKFSNSLHTSSFFSEFLNFKDHMIYEWIAGMDPLEDLSFEPKNILNGNILKHINFNYSDIPVWEFNNTSVYNYKSLKKVNYYTSTTISLDNYLSNLRYSDIIVGDINGDFGWSIDLKSELFGQYSKFIHRLVSVF